MGNEIDALWEPGRLGPGGWIATASPEQVEWCEKIADRMNEVGRSPVWAAVARRFKEKWPDDHAPASTTLADTVRKLADQRG